MATYVAPLRPRVNIFPQILMALAAGLLLFFITTGMITGGYQFTYAGRIFPGVSVGGVDLSGLKPEEAAVKLSQTLVYPYDGRILLRDGDRLWQSTPVELGMVFDVGTSVRRAYDVGRGGGLFLNLSVQLDARQSGMALSPVIVFDQRVAYAYLQNIAAQIDLPVVEADLHLNGTEVVYVPGRIGRLVNIDATLDSLTTQLQSFRDGEVQLVIEEQAPLVLDAASQAGTLGTILSAPLTLYVPDAQEGDSPPWILDLPTLARMIVIERLPSQYQISIDTTALQSLMGDIAAALQRDRQNARFIFNDETRQLDPLQLAVVGRELNVPMTQAAIQTRLLAGEHNLPIEIIYHQPDVPSDATGEVYGITENIVEASTYFWGSSDARMRNIQTAAARFHGLMIGPGETVSMVNVLGDITLETGYEEAWVIINGRTVKDVGGGVCQVSTTLFRAAFYAGFPIVERTPHAYRVSYYERTQFGGRDPFLAGLDATVFVPLVDFKFTNDTNFWLLMETYVNIGARRLTWKFYSTKDGRAVSWTRTGPQNIVPAPEPLFRENPDLHSDEMRQVDWAADGADALWTRTVVYPDGHADYKEFFTRYQPWQAICEYGSGVKKPEKLAEQLGLCQPP